LERAPLALLFADAESGSQPKALMVACVAASSF
jgi:hypothetical protein